jgi:hypothetical protein
MKRLALLAALVGAATLGCGNDNSSANQDMTAPSPDLTAPAADLSTANDDLSMLTGCRGLELCLGGCKGNTACEMACRTNATMMARKLAKALNACRQTTCDGGDGGAGPCVAGMPQSATCMQCLKDTITAPGTCSGGGMPSWCGVCYSEFTACESDTP